MSGSGARDATESANRQELCVNEFTNGASGENSRPKMIILKSCEGVEFTVPLAVAEQSALVKSIVDTSAECIMLRVVMAPVLECMISFWTEHLGSDKFTKEREEEVQNWEKRFIDEMNHKQLFYLLLAADFMEAKELFNRTHKYSLQLPIQFSIRTELRVCR